VGKELDAILDTSTEETNIHFQRLVMIIGWA